VLAVRRWRVHSALVRGLASGAVAALLAGTVGFACGSPAAKRPSNDTFCASADKLFNNETFASDGGGAVDALRGLDVANLRGDDQDAFSTAIGTVEANIAAFNNGQAPDGWSTTPAATVAARICSKDMSNFFVVP